MKSSSTQLIKQLKEITDKLDGIEFLIFNLNNENYHTVFKIIFKYLKEIEYQLDVLQKHEIHKEVFNLLQEQYYNITLLIEKMADRCF